MVDVDKVLLLSWFGHFDLLQMEYILVSAVAPNQSYALDLHVSAQCPHSLHPLSISNGSMREKARLAQILATSVHVRYCVDFSFYDISIHTSSPLLECKFLEDKPFF